jgi:hypothetical protein
VPLAVGPLALDGAIARRAAPPAQQQRAPALPPGSPARGAASGDGGGGALGGALGGAPRGARAQHLRGADVSLLKFAL